MSRWIALGVADVLALVLLHGGERGVRDTLGVLGSIVAVAGKLPCPIAAKIFDLIVQRQRLYVAS